MSKIIKDSEGNVTIIHGYVLDEDLSESEMKQIGLQKLRAKLLGKEVIYTYGTNVKMTNNLTIKNLGIEDGKLMVYFEGGTKIPFKKLAEHDVYKLTDRAIRNHIDKIVQTKNENQLKSYNLASYLVEEDPGIIKWEKVNIDEDDIDWLDKNIVSITAQIPNTKLKAFYRTFDTNYEPITSNNRWDYSFTIKFKQVDDMPESIKSITNKEGAKVDLNNKIMRNTDYAATLIKTYPDLFDFGAHTPHQN